MEGILKQSTELVTIQKNGKYILKNNKDRGLANKYLHKAGMLKKTINILYEKMWKANQETGGKIKHEWNNQLTVPAAIYDMLSEAIEELDAKIEKENAEKAKNKKKRIEDLRKKTGDSDIIDMPVQEIIRKIEKLKETRKQVTIKCKIEDQEKCVIYIINEFTKNIGFFKFLKPNESEIRKYIKQTAGKIEFPGVKIWTDSKTIVTGK